ncbi:hypothetical protein [Lacticaseibacillus pantheris]|uniref:hypothetical protein n=1 Tax=Lacticaseibacillus pantheris TaxID=171523 RepID=UPI0006CFC97E|nr:hypothetical protein [Lacticaseibacillus pantheris]
MAPSAASQAESAQSSASSAAAVAAPTLDRPTVTANGETATLIGTATAGSTITVTVDGVAQSPVAVSATGTYNITAKAGATVKLSRPKTVSPASP